MHKTILDKEVWEVPNVQEEQIIALHAELNILRVYRKMSGNNKIATPRTTENIGSTTKTNLQPKMELY